MFFGWCSTWTVSLAAGCGRHHSIPSSIWFLGIKITRLETTLTRWVPHVESQTREFSIIYITVIYHLSLDRCCFLSINTWPVFFVDFWLDPGLLDQKIAEELLNWTDPTHWSVQIKAPCCTRFFNRKVVVVVKWQSEMGMLTLPCMVLSSSSGSRQSGTYATWLSSEVSASGSWTSSYSNNRTILQYTSEMFCTSAMF